MNSLLTYSMMRVISHADVNHKIFMIVNAIFGSKDVCILICIFLNIVSYGIL